MLEVVVAVLGVLLAQRGEGRRVPVITRFDEPADHVEPQPGEARPVLVPAVDQQGGARIRREVPDAPEGPRVRAGFRLLVERRVEDEAAGRIADGDEAHRN